MTKLRPFFKNDAPRLAVSAAIMLVSCLIWPNAVESAGIKLPVMILGVTFASALALSSALSSPAPLIRFSLLDLAVIAFFGLQGFSAFTHGDQAHASQALSLAFGSLLLYALGRRLFDHAGTAALTHQIAWLAIFLCAVGIAQFLFPGDLPLDFHLSSGGRIPSLAGNSSFFASYLLLVVPLFAGMALRIGRSRRSPALAWSATGLAAALILLTRSLSALAGLAAAGLIFVLLTWRSAPHLRTRILPLLVAVGLLSSVIILSRDSSSLARRIPIWNAGIRAFAAAPLFGHGTGSFESSAMVYRDPDYWRSGSEDVIPHAHNELIEIAVEQGILGLALFLTIAGVLITGIRRRPGNDDLVLAGLVSGFAGIAVDGMASVSLRQPGVASLAWLLFGLASSRLVHPSTSRTFGLAMPAGPLLRALPLLLWIGFAGFYLPGAIRDIRSDVLTLQGIERLEQSPAESAAVLGKAVAENPSNLLARSYLANSLLRTGSWSGAIAAVHDLQAFSPAYPKSSLAAAYAWYRLGRPAEALAAISTELQHRSHPESVTLEAAIRRLATAP